MWVVQAFEEASAVVQERLEVEQSTEEVVLVVETGRENEA